MKKKLLGILFGVGIFSSPVMAQSSQQEDKLLFSSGFEHGIYTAPVNDGYMPIKGGNWPIDIYGAVGSSFHVISNNHTGDQLINQAILDAYIDEVVGHNGKNSDVLVTHKHHHPEGYNEETDYTQIPYEIRFHEDHRPKKDLYIRYWMKVGSLDNEPKENGVWRALFQYKTPSYDDGTGNDEGLRLSAYIYKDKGENNYYWHIKGDNNPGEWNLNEGNDPATWFVSNKKVPVPINEWFLTEYYWHWDEGNEGNEGKIVWKVNGQVIAEHHGPTTRNEEPINIIMLSQTYGNQSNLFQFVDDVEIWNHLPSRYKGITKISAGDKLSSFAAHRDYIYYKIPAKENDQLTAVLDRLSADADLYVRVGSKPTLKNFDCRSYKSNKSVENCSLTLEQDDDIYVLVYGYEAAKYRLKVDVSDE